MELDSIKLDFVETRRERYQPGRRYPNIRFGTIAEDVYRRDFTVNALYMEVFSAEVLDPSGRGLADLQEGVIRTLRDADQVISEDYLRILRAIRFSATLGFALDPDIRRAIEKYAPKIGRLSQSAIFREVEKMKAAGVWAEARALMQELGLEDAIPPDGVQIPL
jgi:tRNA nucleotidyltransferase/poly(A) polymerase